MTLRGHRIKFFSKSDQWRNFHRKANPLLLFSMGKILKSFVFIFERNFSPHFTQILSETIFLKRATNALLMIKFDMYRFYS